MTLRHSLGGEGKPGFDSLTSDRGGSGLFEGINFSVDPEWDRA